MFRGEEVSLNPPRKLVTTAKRVDAFVECGKPVIRCLAGKPARRVDHFGERFVIA